jgi:hypothetical protein
MSREAFERIFGKSEPPKVDAEQEPGTISSTNYPLAAWHLNVFFSNEGKTVSNVSTASGKPEPYGAAPNTAHLAREHADTERALLLAFLTRRYSGGDLKELEILRGIVDKSQPDAQWTPEERESLLGAAP